MGARRKLLEKVPLRAARGRPRRFSEDALIDAALRLIGRDGHAALTLRALAGELGVSHTALYTYVDAIGEIERKAVRRLTDRLPRPTAASGPELREQLLDYLQSARSLLKVHPGVVLAGGPAASGAFSEIGAQWNEALLAYAPDLKTVHLALGALVGSVLLFVECERLVEEGQVPSRDLPTKRAQEQAVERYLDDLLGLVLPGLSRKAGRKNKQSQER